MKELLSKNKGVVRFLAVFLGSYTILSLLYAWYLNGASSPDEYTKFISDQTVYLLNGLGYDTISEINRIEGRVKLYTEGRFIAFIMEGCNALSIMILFTAFVLAFAKRFKQTLLFLLLGLVFIYLVNLFRIVLLTVCLYHYPHQTEILHSVVFPVIIYGAVFVLWVIWVRILQKPAKYVE